VLSAYDARAAAVEVVSRWVALSRLAALPAYEAQLVALEALQVYAPLAHALGLGPLAAAMEDAAFGCLFPGSYASVGAWLRRLSARTHETLERARTELAAAVAADAEFATLAAGCEVRFEGCAASYLAFLANINSLQKFYAQTHANTHKNPRTTKPTPTNSCARAPRASTASCASS
jgi:hypothetical protein